ncbi:hypothetical protein [Sphingobacterium endophyticum]|uniref:hypothetical protein n=1 Tax=Sphingobacterium endophyticum TaxID=2546448 RepID=UPI0012E2A364|nr:hypothetical protein [Sphingobacterium endophyticum]
MKLLLMLLSLCYGTLLLGQEIKPTQSNIEIFDRDGKKKFPLIEINGVTYENIEKFRLDPNSIDSLDVIKDFNKSNFSGIIKIKLKNNKKVELRTLPDIRKLNGDETNSPIIYIVDNNLVTINPNHFLIDKEFILSISKGKLRVEGLEQELSTLTVLTKTAENIKEKNKIMIR